MQKELLRTHEHAAVQPTGEADDPMPEINALSPTPLRAEEVHARSMVLCTDLVCEADACRFSAGALEEIARKIVGVSVLAGHDRKSLPVGRFFRGRVVELPEPNPITRRPVVAVRAWFYWLVETSGAEDLRLNIDGGIYRAVSISWRYGQDACSVCGAVSGCGHAPGQVYQGQVCHRVIEHVDDVLEGSLVFKGADTAAQLARARGAETPTARGGHLSWDRAWIEFCAQVLAELPRDSFTCRARGALARETGAILHNLGWRVLAPACECLPSLLWHTAVEGESIDYAPLGGRVAGRGRLLLCGAGQRAPLAQLPRGFRLARLLSLPCWNSPWWVVELEREVQA